MMLQLKIMMKINFIHPGRLDLNNLNRIMWKNLIWPKKNKEINRIQSTCHLLKMRNNLNSLWKILPKEKFRNRWFRNKKMLVCLHQLFLNLFLISMSLQSFWRINLWLFLKNIWRKSIGWSHWIRGKAILLRNIEVIIFGKGSGM